MILRSMEEATKEEVYIKNLNEETINSLINFIYTGDFDITPDLDVKGIDFAGVLYDLKGFIQLLCFKLKQEVNLKPGTIGDMLIAASIYDIKELRGLVLDRIRTNRNIMNEEDKTF